MQHHELTRALRVVDKMDRLAPLLDVPNQPDSDEPSKRQLALREVDEIALELLLDGTPRFSPKKTAGETADAFVFLRAWLESQAVDLDVTQGASFINGAGNRSDSLEVLRTLLAESEDDPRAAREAIFMLISLYRHLRIPGTFLKQVIITADKALRNRSPFAYQITENGKPLTPQEQKLSYQFKERAFRMIRNAVKRTTGREALELSDWWPYRHIISAWREGEPKLIELRALLAVELGEDQQTPMGVFVPNPAQTYLYGGRGSQHIQ